MTTGRLPSVPAILSFNMIAPRRVLVKAVRVLCARPGSTHAAACMPGSLEMHSHTCMAQQPHSRQSAPKRVMKQTGMCRSNRRTLNNDSSGTLAPAYTSAPAHTFAAAHPADCLRYKRPALNHGGQRPRRQRGRPQRQLRLDVVKHAARLRGVPQEARLARAAALAASSSGAAFHACCAALCL